MSIKDLEVLLSRLATLDQLVENLTTRLLTAERRVAALERKVYDGKRPTPYEINHVQTGIKKD